MLLVWVVRELLSETATWTAEGDIITPSDPTFDRIELRPKKLAAMTFASNEVMADSNPPVREVVADDLAKTIAGTLDVAFLKGNGIGASPTGLRNTAGVNAVQLGTTDGAQPTLDDVEDAIARVEAANATPKAIFMSPQVWAYLRGLKDGGGRSLVQPDQTSTASRSLFGVPVYVTGNIKHDETVGTSSDCAYIVVADLDQVIVGRRKVV